MTLLQIILATTLVSSISLIAAWFISALPGKHKNITFWLVSLSAGTLMGGAFWHLLPEAIESVGVMPTMTTTLGSFVAFYIIEKVLHWQHCHNPSHEHSFGYLNVVGDAIHNFLDGVSIAAAFVINPLLGINTAFAIALHELPQELGDIGTLMHAGFSRKKALLANFGVALTAVVGGVVGYGLTMYVQAIVPYLLPVAAGSFLYIASSDLIPELRQERDPMRSFWALAWFVLGLVIMYLALFTEPH